MTGVEDIDVLSATMGGVTPHPGNHYDRRKGVPEIVRRHALSQPEAIAIICDDAALTYGELDRISDSLASYLISCGVEKGDVVCLLVPRSLQTVVAKLAILKAGAAYLPLDPAYPADHLHYVLQECRPKVVFTFGAPPPALTPTAGPVRRIVDLPALLKDLRTGDTSRFPVIDGTDLAYVMYTSGSTGRPKGVAVPHAGITRLVLDQNFIAFSPADRILHSTTISFDASTVDVWGALLNGATLVIMPKANFSLTDMRDLIRKHEITFLNFTTGLFNVFADHVDEPMPSLRQAIFGGEVASAAHVKRFIAAHPACTLTNVYGPTEASCIATTFTVPRYFTGGELPIGEPIAHTQVCLLDEEFQLVPPGIEGQIAIAGDGLALGYFNRPELTADRFVFIDAPEGKRRCYLTGDLAVMDEAGTFHFRGRRDRQVKINGKRIELEEIETVLRRQPRLAEAVVECREIGGVKRVIAYLRPAEAQDLANSNFVPSIMERLRSSLPAYMIPSTAMVMAEFPLNHAGKIDRAALPLPPVEDAPPIAQRSHSEDILMKLWRDALGLEAVPADRNFFDLGGTSLQLMRVHAGLELALGQRLEVLSLFKHPTVRDMARFLDGQGQNPSRTAAAGQRAAQQRRTMSQFRRSTP